MYRSARNYFIRFIINSECSVGSISVAGVITGYHTELTAGFFSFLYFAVISINVSFQFNMLWVQALLYNSSDYHSDLQEAIKQNVNTLFYMFFRLPLCR